jgi:hypothetical protein
LVASARAVKTAVIMTLVDRLSRTEALVCELVIVEEAGKVTRPINISFR